MFACRVQPHALNFKMIHAYVQSSICVCMSFQSDANTPETNDKLVHGLKSEPSQ